MAHAVPRAAMRQWSDEELRWRLSQSEPTSQREPWVTTRIGQVAIRDRAFAAALADRLLDTARFGSSVRTRFHTEAFCSVEEGFARAKRGPRDTIGYGPGTAGKAEWVFRRPRTLPLVVEVKLTANLRHMQLSDYIDVRSGSPRRALVLCRYVPPWVELVQAEWPYFAGVSLWRDLFSLLKGARPAGVEDEWSAFVERIERHDLAGVPATDWTALAQSDAATYPGVARRLLEDIWPWLLIRVQGSACRGEYGPGRPQEEQAVRGKKTPKVAIYRGNGRQPVLTITLRPRPRTLPIVILEERRPASDRQRTRRGTAEVRRLEVSLECTRDDPATVLRETLLGANLWLLDRPGQHVTRPA